MSTTHRMTPSEMASLLVPRFLAREPDLTVTVLTKQYRNPRWVVQRAVRISRTILRVEHGCVLPIAHRDDFVLLVTTDALTAYRGELPQVRGYQTLGEHMSERLTWTMDRLENESPALAKSILIALDAQMHSLNAVLNTVDTYMVERIHGGAA